VIVKGIWCKYLLIVTSFIEIIGLQAKEYFPQKLKREAGKSYLVVL